MSPLCFAFEGASVLPLTHFRAAASIVTHPGLRVAKASARLEANVSVTGPRVTGLSRCSVQWELRVKTLDAQWPRGGGATAGTCQVPVGVCPMTDRSLPTVPF